MTAAFTPKQVRSSRIKLVVLWAIPFGLMAIAAVVYNLVESGVISVGSKNEGVLIQPPIQLSGLALTTNVPLVRDNIWQGKWSIVVRGDADCDAECLDTLLITRQIHKRLNKEGNRVQRVYLSTVPALSEELATHLAAENHYMKLAVVDEIANESDNQLALVELDDVLAGANQTVRFFLVDPDGWAMMYYLNEHDGVVILKDLKYLLKYSKER
ncbi:SCO family protein [Pseudomonadales bacterium]|nr:SCO family protein [Pseudomonadales bacterium]